MDILFNIRFIKKFDKTRYSNMIIYMDKLMKIYIYILADRYDINIYLPIFTDTKNSIIEIFYSLIFVVPNKILICWYSVILAIFKISVSNTLYLVWLSATLVASNKDI